MFKYRTSFLNCSFMFYFLKKRKNVNDIKSGLIHYSEKVPKHQNLFKIQTQFIRLN